MRDSGKYTDTAITIHVNVILNGLFALDIYQFVIKKYNII